jgi:hypothetical protein
MFGIIILIRILFAACMVFIIGYVFGNFSKRPTLAAISKVASILAIVLFISANIFFFVLTAGIMELIMEKVIADIIKKIA